MLKINGIVSAGSSSMVPGEMYIFNSNTIPYSFSRDQTFQMDNLLVDYGFLDTFDIDVVLGSLYSPIAPTFIQYVSDEGAIENRARKLILRLETESLTETTALIEQTWKNAYPHIPFYSFFLDDFYDSQHRAEEKLGGIFRNFTIMAVLIACIGLFSLASFMAERRTKEIGIRKVIGSSVVSLVMLLCREFLVLIAVATAIAWPIAYYAVKKWLQNFPYAVKLDTWIFVLTALVILIFSSFTVGYKAVKAARANPVDSLRYE